MAQILLSLNTAPIGELQMDGARVASAIAKRPIDGRRRVEPLGIEGDAQADGTAHGGIAKAVCAYPSEHYPFWDTVRAQMGVAPWTDRLAPGALGENLTLAGLLESAVWVGDLLRFPDCVLAVSEPRSTCAKLDAALGFRHASAAMTAQAWSGFYLAVRVPGTIAAGESFEVVAGPREIGITELFRSRTGT